MPGPFDAVTTKDPTKYGALGMGGRQFTGLWTQRSPYRDADVPYLVAKFYGGSRFDSILEGLNREITAKLTDGRRPGTMPYGTPAIGSLPAAALGFFSFKSVGALTGTEQVQVIGDTAAHLYDITNGLNVNFLNKAAGSGKTRFLGVRQSLFLSDGVDQKKLISPGGWVAATKVAPGTLINNVAYDPAGQILLMALGGITLNVVATASSGTVVTVWVDPANIPEQFANLVSVNVTFAGLTTETYLNGTTHAITDILSSTLGIFTITLSHSSYAKTVDTGTASTGNGTTGSSQPSWTLTEFLVTQDSGQQWKSYGLSLENWGLQTPTTPPTLTPQNGTRFWQPNTSIAVWYAILDGNLNVQVNEFAPGVTGPSYPIFLPLGPITITQTSDGTVTWNNWGKIGTWSASTNFGNPPTQTAVILDSNQNLQLVTGGNGGASAGSPPSWMTTIGVTTSDGALTWTCLGPGVTLTTASIIYSFSTQGVDGSVSTAAPPVTIYGPILGPPAAVGQSYIQIAGSWVFDSQIAQLWIWRTAQGKATLILEDQIPVDPFWIASAFTYQELGIPDVPVNGSGALDALIAAPIADANDPPVVGATGPVYHLGRVWTFYQNKVFYSGGPDTLVGNGNTAWPPLNQIVYPGEVIKLRPITVQNGGMLVYTTAGIQIILGTGTLTNPFYSTVYCASIILGGFDAEDVLGTVIYMMESNAMVSSLTIEYPFNPQSGYTEVGFPIGDQFVKVTTGGISSALYNPATTFLSWNRNRSGDTGMYVADGAVGWFRLSVINPPESGLVWSPRAAITGGTSAVQNIETAPGVFNLLIGAPGAGIVLKRDTSGTVWSDGAGLSPYPAWDAKGITQLCTTGEQAVVAWIATKSAAVGARPVISLLMNEIYAGANSPWSQLQPTGQDPSDLAPSQTVYCDRYNGEQSGKPSKGDTVLILFDYGSQIFGDELLEFQIYGSKEDERKQ